ncbi:hypothetical protein GCM10017752_18030 [Streptomyces roseoviridis]
MDQDLPGADGEEGEAEEGDEDPEGPEGSRPPRNRGGGSGAVVVTGLPRAPGGVGRAAIRSVRSSGAQGSSGVREGTVRAGLGRLRPGCFSHLRKPYGTRKGTDSRIAIPPSAPHSFFTQGVRSGLPVVRYGPAPTR